MTEPPTRAATDPLLARDSPFWDELTRAIDERSPASWEAPPDAESFRRMLKALDRYACYQQPAPPAIRVLRQGVDVPPQDYLRSTPAAFGGHVLHRVSERKLAAVVDGGATVVLNGVHHSVDPVRAFALLLAWKTGVRTQANAYLSAHRSTGFPRHCDGHDVLVVQLAGEKHWTLCKPVWEEPTGTIVPEIDYSRAIPHDSLTLRPGSLLYLPRGWIHEAESSNHGSVHVTFGLLPWTGVDYLHWLVEMLSRLNVEMRRALPPLRPPVHVGDPDPAREYCGQLRSLFGLALRNVTDDDFLRMHRSSQPSIGTARFVIRKRHATTCYRWNSVLVPRLERVTRTGVKYISVELRDKRALFREEASTFLESLIHAYTFTLADATAIHPECSHVDALYVIDTLLDCGLLCAAE